MSKLLGVFLLAAVASAHMHLTFPPGYSKSDNPAAKDSLCNGEKPSGEPTLVKPEFDLKFSVKKGHPGECTVYWIPEGTDPKDGVVVTTKKRLFEIRQKKTIFPR